MYKVDLHTHSSQSPDGGITSEQYSEILQKKVLDYIAVTDHDDIEMALSLHATLGDRIIVGQEVSTTEGEIIGLFLKKIVKPNMSIYEAIHEIKSQKGLVYIPHPFETIRKGITEETLDNVKNEVDIVEVHNGRALLQNRGPKSLTWTRMNNKAGASSSDAHGIKGLGGSFSLLDKPPTRYNLVELLEKAHYKTQRTSLRALLYPKSNKLKKRFR